MRRNTLVVACVALAAIAIGVYFFLSGNLSNASLSALSGQQQSAVVVPFTPLASGSSSKVETRVNYFITSPTQLQELWSLVDATGTPPTVDFNKDAVIAVFAGQQPTTGYAISVSKVVDSGARLVSITIAKPDGGCLTGQSLTTPYEVVVVPTTTLPLAHEDLSATIACDN
ncbi:MAG: protease complex subunit PrcB family protein [Minisyncoccia bacterium]